MFPCLINSIGERGARQLSELKLHDRAIRGDEGGCGIAGDFEGSGKPTVGIKREILQDMSCASKMVSAAERKSK